MLDNQGKRVWRKAASCSRVRKSLSILGTAYIERALPLSNLDTYDKKYPYNYYLYEVLKEYYVLLDPIAP